MIGRVVVMPQDDYEAWLGGGATEGTLAAARREAVHAVRLRHLPPGGDTQAAGRC